MIHNHARVVRGNVSDCLTRNANSTLASVFFVVY